MVCSGCIPQQCLRPTLPETPQPLLKEIKLVPLEEADYGITDRARRDLLINFTLYKEALDSCNSIINTYNRSVGNPILSK
jgi:hypothetical protein